MAKKPDLRNYVSPGDFEAHVTDLYREMELEMIASLKRNLAGHKGEEIKVGMDYTAWQAAKLKELSRYRLQNRRMVQGYTNDIYRQLGPTLLEEFQQGIIGEKSRYAAAGGDPLQASFFAIDGRKVNALIAELRGSFKTANAAALRMCNDVYRQVIFDTTLFAANGVLTEKQAFDRAIKKFTERGINCIEYTNGSRHNIAEYTSMAIRTAHLRANLMGAGEFRRQLGEHLIIITTHGTACPLCIPWEGNILIDDVYSGGSRADGNYPLLSEAMKAGLYHPNCRHGSGTYYPELEEVEREVFGDNAKEKAAAAHAEHQVQKFKRLSAGCLDPKLKAKYDARLKEWERIHKNALNSLTSLGASGTMQARGKAKAPSGAAPAKKALTRKQAAIDQLLANFGITFRDSRKYPMDESLLVDCVDWLENFQARFPGFKTKNPVALPEIVCAPPSKMKNAVGMYTYYPTKPAAEGIKLNGQYHADAKGFQQYVDRSVKSGWYPANATLRKTFVHEYGHHVSNSMRWISQSPNWQKEFLQDCLADYRKANPSFTGQTHASTSNLVSRYGASDWGELFAESFAEYYGGQNPRAFAQIFGTKLDAVLKGV